MLRMVSVNLRLKSRNLQQQSQVPELPPCQEDAGPQRGAHPKQRTPAKAWLLPQGQSEKSSTGLRICQVIFEKKPLVPEGGTVTSKTHLLLQVQRQVTRADKIKHRILQSLPADLQASVSDLSLPHVPHPRCLLLTIIKGKKEGFFPRFLHSYLDILY